MPVFPAGIDVTTLTGRFLHPDGSPASGSVSFHGPGKVTFPSADTMMVGSLEVPLDDEGEFSVQLVATDNPGMNPAGWTYTVTERIYGSAGRSYAIFLAADPLDVDLADIAPSSPATGTYLPVVGPQGPPTTVNGHTGLSITLTAADVGADTAGAAATAQSAAQAYTDTKTAAEVVRADGAYLARTDPAVTDARPPTGTAGGALSGSYPSPTLSSTTVGQFDAAGAAASAQAAAATDATTKVATHVAATDPHGDRASAATQLTAHTTASDPHGDRANAATTYARLDANLSDLASPATARSNLALGNAAVRSVGQAAGTVAAGDDGRFTDSRTPTGAAGGALTGSYPNPTLAVATSALFDAAGTANAAQSAAQAYADTKTASEVTRADAAYVSTRAGVWRRRDLPPTALRRSLYAALGGTCTTTIAQTTTPTAGYIGWRPAPVALTGSGSTIDQTGLFTYGGGDEIVLSDTVSPGTSYVVATSLDPHVYTNNVGCYSVCFGTHSRYFQARLRYMATTDAIRIYIDGSAVTDLPVLLSGMSGIGTAGAGHMLSVDLGSDAARHIRIEIIGCRFGGIYLPPQYNMWKVSLRGPKVGVLGDSITGGSNVNTGGSGGTWFARMCNLFGWENYWNQSRGGTGYITTNSPYTTFPNRVALDIVGKNFDLVILNGGFNDSSISQSTFQTAVYSVIDAVKAGLPNAVVVGVGCYTNVGAWAPTSSTVPSGTLNKDAWLAECFQSRSVPFISQISGDIRDKSWTLLDTQGPWLTGAGRVGATTGYGNADIFIGDGTDTIHPTNAFHNTMGERMASAFRQLFAV